MFFCLGLATIWPAPLCARAGAAGKGVVRVSARDPHQLQFADGAPYVAIGENLGWYGPGGVKDYEKWMKKLSAQGANFIRVWMPSWAFGVEWTGKDARTGQKISGLGDYTHRLDRARQLDEVFRLARRHGLYVMLCLQNHGAFSLAHNSEWPDNPYNAANGGPLKEPREFFTHPKARALFKQRLRFIVKRWGDEPGLLAWELWNEADLAQQPSPVALVAWHREMARYLRSLDKRGHLITTSFANALSPIAEGVWRLPEMDVAQLHLYAAPPLITWDFTRALPEKLGALRRFGKPVLAAEVGVDYRGPAETLKADPSSSGFHDLLWAGLMGGGFGVGMTWWWDNVVDPKNLYSHLGPINRLVQGVVFHQERFAPQFFSAKSAQGPLRVLALKGKKTFLAWVKNPRHLWFKKVDETVQTQASVALTGMPPGRWRGLWQDPYGQKPDVPAILEISPNGEAVFPMPDFSKDLALRLERQGK